MEVNIKPEGRTTWGCCTVKYIASKILTMSLIASVYHLSIAISALPIRYIVNQRISGDALEPNSASAFTDITMTLLRSVSGFLTQRYACGISDYIGRKPVLYFAAIGLCASRVVIYFAMTPLVFYLGSIISGVTDAFYFVTLAWLCDFCIEQDTRSRYVGYLASSAAGFSLLFGVPLGLFFSGFFGFKFPLILTIGGGLSCVILLILTNTPDKLGIRTEYNVAKPWGDGRHLPADFKAFFFEHFPISIGTLRIMKQCRRPWIWLSNFLLNITATTLIMLFLQYTIVVFQLTPALTGLCAFVLGILVAIVPGFVMSRFKAIAVVFYGGAVFTTGMVLWAIAGSVQSLVAARVIGICGIFLLGLGAVWAPAYQAVITKEYDASTQGIASGMLSQSRDIAILPAYLISLMFTYSLRGSSGLVKGSPLYLSSALAVCALISHYHSYKSKALIIVRKDTVQPEIFDKRIVSTHASSGELESSQGAERDGFIGDVNNRESLSMQNVASISPAYLTCDHRNDRVAESDISKEDVSESGCCRDV